MTRTPTPVDHLDPDLAPDPLAGLPLRERLALATRLEARLVEHVLRPANAEAVRRQAEYVGSQVLTHDPDADDDPELRGAMVLDGAVDMLVHSGPRGVGGSLVQRLLGAEPPADAVGSAPAGLVLTAAERALLEPWRDGGVLGYFMVTDLVDEHAMLHNLEDDLDYRVYTGCSEIRSAALAPGLPLSGRVLPVGAAWIFADTPFVFPPSAMVDVVRGVVTLLSSTPCPAYRNPRTLARARELVADHHRAFRDLFGDVLVEGTASHVMDCYLRFKHQVGAPAEEFALLPALRDERWLPDDAADPDDASFALAHHPVKGLRLLDWYGQLREVHTAPWQPWKPQRLAQVLADPDVPSWVLALLAERHPDHLDGLYGTAAGRPGFAWADDGAALLATREPAAGHDEPGLVMASSVMGRVQPPDELTGVRPTA
ncbi:hypothetical protein [Promicromonospora iranensis]|uniref:Uncharacterized protein n=1 Tax=Promicromonospora iranensis TaxID=1105144 RepID=A0ABU2CTJ5_9MICO|nr:hypothetical protein [Promicromonospora iranensis]MDR7384664.1 hypothetical protein [Promicromonospora iranensis]